MSASEYFDQQTRKRGIKREWCEAIVRNPIATELQPDGRERSQREHDGAPGCQRRERDGGCELDHGVNL